MVERLTSDNVYLIFSCSWICFRWFKNIGRKFVRLITVAQTVSGGFPQWTWSGELLGIIYGLLPMIFHRESIDPNLLPAASAILAGFGLFQCDPLGDWLWESASLSFHFGSSICGRFSQRIGWLSLLNLPAHWGRPVDSIAWNDLIVVRDTRTWQSWSPKTKDSGPVYGAMHVSFFKLMLRTVADRFRFSMVFL